MSKDLSFWEHIEALRRMLIRTILVLSVLIVVVFLNKSLVFDSLLLAPRSSNFILYRWMNALDNALPFLNLHINSFNLQLININLSSQFLIHISTSFWIALVVGFPYVIWEIWRFVAPALYPNEQRSVKYAFLFSSLLFYMGVVVAYVLIFPLTIHFLGNYQVSESITNQITLQSYISTLISLALSMGVVFELPILVYVLSHIGIINRAFMRRYRRHAIVLLLVLAAIITPADIFSMIMAAIPLYLLFELSVLVCKK